MDTFEKESDEIIQIYMSDDKESDGIDQIGENDEDRLTGDIEFLKLGKLGSQENIDNVEKEHGERNWIDMSSEKESDERDKIGQNDEYRLTDDIEFLELVKLSSQKNIDNIGKESYKINQIDIIDDKESVETYQI